MIWKHFDGTCLPFVGLIRNETDSLNTHPFVQYARCMIQCIYRYYVVLQSITYHFDAMI